jgi:hypothetical protein
LAIVITVTCEGLDHRLEFRDDGEVVMLDHSEKLVRSFVAFGAKPPSCMEQIDEAREWPVDYLLDHLKAGRKTIVMLACAFAEHVLPIWYEYYPNDKRPEKAIQAARKYMAGKIELPTLRRAHKAADEAWAAAYALAEAERAASAAGDAAEWAAEWAAADAAWAAWTAADAALASRSAPLTSKLSVCEASAEAADAAYHHAESRGKDPDAAEAAEKKWQASRMVQVLEAISRGEDPWRS